MKQSHPLTQSFRYSLSGLVACGLAIALFSSVFLTFLVYLFSSGYVDDLRMSGAPCPAWAADTVYVSRIALWTALGSTPFVHGLGVALAVFGLNAKNRIPLFSRIAAFVHLSSGGLATALWIVGIGAALYRA